MGHHMAAARTGVFRVAEHVAAGLSRHEDVALSLCAGARLLSGDTTINPMCEAYLRESGNLRGVPFYAEHLPGFDLYHSPYHPLPSHIQQPRFLMIHDMIAVKFPHFFTPPQVWDAHRLLACIRPSDFFFANSEATRRDFCEITHILAEQVFVTHLAASPDLFFPCRDMARLATIRAKYGLGDYPYILSLCTFEPRKNLEQVIRCFIDLVQANEVPELRLVLVGTKGWEYERIFGALNQTGDQLRNRIVLTGYVPDDDLAPLYSAAEAFIYLSRYEGFGLPPLEAMQCGTPVITSNTSSLPEVVGDAGILLNPADHDAICRQSWTSTGTPFPETAVYIGA